MKQIRVFETIRTLAHSWAEVINDAYDFFAYLRLCCSCWHILFKFSVRFKSLGPELSGSTPDPALRNHAKLSLRPTGYALSLFCARVSPNFNPAAGTRDFLEWGKAEKHNTTSTSTGVLTLLCSLGKYFCMVCLEGKARMSKTFLADSLDEV
jgi:hypothetical protein